MPPGTSKGIIIKLLSKLHIAPEIGRRGVDCGYEALTVEATVP